MSDPAPTAPSAESELRVRPRAVERPVDGGWTLIGGVDDPRPARLDQGGLLSPAGVGWSIDWWVGADDRWHVPAREPSARQRRLGPGPVVETAVRVPSGDVVATVYPAMTPGPDAKRATAVEIRNDSPVPVTVALAVRPYPVGQSVPDLAAGPVDGPGSIEVIEVIEEPQPMVTVGGAPALVLPRRPNEAGVDDHRDLFELVESGRPLPGPAAPGPGPAGPIPNAVCLYPLPHQATLRFSVPQFDDRRSPTVASPDAFPPPERVRAGWASVIDQAGRFDFPDEGLTSLAGAARARLVLGASRLASAVARSDTAAMTAWFPPVLRALAFGGHRAECRLVVDGLTNHFPTKLEAEPEVGAELLAAVATTGELIDPGLAEPLLEWATRLTSLVDRGDAAASTVAAHRALARLAAQAGQIDAARHLRTVAPPAVDLEAGAGRRLDLDAVMALAQQASAAGSWPQGDSIEAAARFWLAARALMIDFDDDLDLSSADDPIEIRLLPTMPSAWMGGPVEVSGAPVPGARVSYAVRWHGYRPALLWEVEPSPLGPSSRPGRWRVCCPGLDPTWSTEALRGEILLAGSPSELPAAPAAGESFT